MNRTIEKLNELIDELSNITDESEEYRRGLYRAIFLIEKMILRIKMEEQA